MKKGKGGIDYSEWSYDKKRLSYSNFYQEQSDNDNYYDAYNANQSQEQDYYNDDNLYLDRNYYNALPYTKSYKPKLKKSEIITAVALLLTGFFITVFLTTLLAQGLNIGHLLGKLNKAETKKTQYYAVQLGAFSSESQALTASEAIRELGGGGYILVDGPYRIIAAVYPEEQQAISVMANITQFSSEKYIITAPEIVMNFTDKKVKEMVEKSLYQWDAIYKRLYNHSIQLDKAQTTEVAVLQDLQLIYGDLDKHLNEYDQLTKDLSRIEHIYIKTGLKRLLTTLKSLLNIRSNAQLSSDLKYAYTKILIDYKNLANQLNR
jgi:hypothetical protein